MHTHADAHAQAIATLGDVAAAMRMGARHRAVGRTEVRTHARRARHVGTHQSADTHIPTQKR